MMKIYWAVAALLLFSATSAHLSVESSMPPSWNYSAQQLLVLAQYGNPHHFTILFDQQAKFRYETWVYGGRNGRMFGFVNGAKTLEKTVGSSLSAEGKVVGITPKQFTFNTTAANLQNMFGKPSRILEDGTSRSILYTAKGLSVTLLKSRVISIGTVPPVR